MKRPVDQLFPGLEREANITAARCVMAKSGHCEGTGSAEKFNDDISAREFKISGLCQACQDNVFGGEGE